MSTRKKRRAVIIAAVILLLALLLGGDTWTRLYVRLNARKLESFAAAALESEEVSRYGIWVVSRYPEAGMVEFLTGGYGLAPSTVYKGFYYPASDEHIPFQAVEQPMEESGDTARWQEPAGDNWGTSRRIVPRWFWYEAHF